MKTYLNHQLLLPVLIASLGLIPAGRGTAQTFTTLHSFTFGSDGGFPEAGLVLSGNTLYGAAAFGGSPARGTVFKVNTDGSAFTNLHSFTATSGSLETNSDGATPFGELILSGSTLYGAAYSGGSSGNGTVFKVNTNGTGFTTLYNFTATSGSLNSNSDGVNPRAGLILSGAALYGTARKGGSTGSGTVFKVNTNGTGFTTLHSFTEPTAPTYNNSDGANPEAGLVLSGNTLYGTAYNGGASGYGTVFAVNTDGTGFTALHSFTFAGFNSSGIVTNSDGATPFAGLILSGNTLYGVAPQGGNSGQGTVFALNINGTGFTTLHHFTATSAPSHTNSDGASPVAELVLSGSTLYGTAEQGGRTNRGTVFALNTNGTGFTNLYNFTAPSSSFPYTNTDGAYPDGGLILSGNTLYGTAREGGNSDNGTVFSFSLGTVSPPQLTIILSVTNVILTWPTNAAGFTLQSTTNLVSPAVWSTVSPGPVVVNGQNTVTNPISGTQKFFRLSQEL